MTPAELAARLERDLGPLAVDAAWATTTTAGQSEGHYSDPIADAMSDASVSDLTDATPVQLKAIRIAALGGCLDRLERHYATLVDTEANGGSEKLSQIGTAIGRLRASLSTGSSAASGTARGTNLRGVRRPDYALNAGNVEYSA